MASFGLVGEATERDRDTTPARKGDAAPSRALVPLTVASATRDRGEARAAAPFLTHLLATAQGVPQTCARGRAEPTRAAAAYADCMRRPAAWPVAPHETLTAA